MYDPPLQVEYWTTNVIDYSFPIISDDRLRTTTAVEVSSRISESIFSLDQL